MKQLFILLASCLLLGCGGDSSSNRPFVLQGAWVLQQLEYPYDRADDTFSEQEGTYLLMYDGDSVVCQCWMTKTETGLVIKPGIQ